MAIFIQRTKCGAASVTFTYDDVAMKLTEVSAMNNAARPTLRVNIPGVLPRAIILTPGQSLDYEIPRVNQPTFTLVQNRMGELVPAGFAWSISFGA